MRLDQQNRRSCILLLVLLAGLAALVIWGALGGISSESVGDDVKVDIQAPAPNPVGQPTG
jgi:hypothetical protein